MILKNLTETFHMKISFIKTVKIMSTLHRGIFELQRQHPLIKIYENPFLKSRMSGAAFVNSNFHD